MNPEQLAFPVSKIASAENPFAPWFSTNIPITDRVRVGVRVSTTVGVELGLQLIEFYIIYLVCVRTTNMQRHDNIRTFLPSCNVRMLYALKWCSL